MSHSKERKEKICLNCRADLSGIYCHTCGQKNVEPIENAWHLLTHFISHITHFDGKLFNTLRYLFLKPGFLSKEYLSGRRAHYLNPIQMYLFTSACFFIVFFAVFNLNHSNNKGNLHTEQTAADSLYGNWKNARTFALKNANSEKDSIEIEKALKMIGQTSFGAMVDSLDKEKMRSPFIHFMSSSFNSKEDYSFAQQLLPSEQRDGWVSKRITYKQMEVSRNIEKDPDGFFNYWLNNLLHLFPQLLFVSLPLFALLLKFLYWRSGSYYFAHAIFSIHLYISTFVSLVVYFSFTKLQEVFHWGWIRYILAILILYTVFYSYLAMKNFYQQGFFKTFIKYCLLHLLALSVILILFIAFFMLSIFQF